jgi:hypothetical protein
VPSAPLRSTRLCGLVLLALAALLLVAGRPRPPASVPLPDAPGCPVMPARSYWHADVRGLPLHPRSAAWVEAIGEDLPLRSDFGSGEWDGGPIGIPYTTVSGTQPRVEIEFGYEDESDPGPYPIPPDPPIEGGPDSDGDRHVLVVDRDACVLYETFWSWPNGDGSWFAASGAVFDLRGHLLRPAGWTSADAAGLPILPGLVRYDEVAAGRVGHAIRFTAPQTQGTYLWPARHEASDSTNPDHPPMGAWFRLKAGVDAAGFSPQTRPIVEALKKHGMILADNGSAWFLSGVPDERWDNDVLRELRDLHGSDFEAVDASGLMLDPDSARVAP